MGRKISTTMSRRTFGGTDRGCSRRRAGERCQGPSADAAVRHDLDTGRNLGGRGQRLCRGGEEPHQWRAGVQGVSIEPAWKRRELLEGLQLGNLDFTFGGPGVLTNFDPKIGIFDMPFMFRDYVQANKVMDGTSDRKSGTACARRPASGSCHPAPRVSATS